MTLARIPTGALQVILAAAGLLAVGFIDQLLVIAQ